MKTDNIESNFQLLGTRVLELHIENDFIYINDDSEDLKREYDVAYEIGDAFQLDDNSADLAATLVMDVNVIIECEQKKLEIFLSIEACFALDMNENSEKQKTMLEVNGCASLYSIARSTITSITSQICRNGSVILPMINIFHLRDEMEKEKSE